MIEALASDGKTVGEVYVNVEAVGPSISSITPSPAPVGNSTITLHGSGFEKGGYAMVGGAVTGVTFVNSTTLNVAVYQGSAGSVPIQVENPGTLWGPTFYATFAVAPPQTISPTSASVNLGATQQFTSPNATGWTATAGTVSSTGSIVHSACDDAYFE